MTETFGLLDGLHHLGEIEIGGRLLQEEIAIANDDAMTVEVGQGHHHPAGRGLADLSPVRGLVLGKTTTSLKDNYL